MKEVKLPSGELLSLILGECCKESRRIENNNLIYFCSLDWDEGSINIDTLTHKIKMWALTYGFVLRSSADGTVVIDGGWFEDDYCNSDTEFEAVTKAGEWIFEQKESK